MAKAVITENNENKFIPMSGLVTLGSRDGLGSDNKTNTIFPKTEEEIFNSLGLYWSDDPDNTDRRRLSNIGISFANDNENITLSGGLQINVGNYLEIFPNDIPENAKEYYQCGKVNVRLGGGLTDDGENRITLNIEENGGIYIDEETGQIGCTISSSNLNQLRIDDMEEHSFVYNPSGKSIDEDPKYKTFLHLGPGLIISTEELPIPDSAIYIMIGTEPEDWKSCYKSYYISNGDGTYSHVTGDTAPTFVNNRYYRISTMTIDISYPYLTEEPANWSTDYKNYYELKEGDNIPTPITDDEAPEFVANKYFDKVYTAYIPGEESSSS